MKKEKFAAAVNGSLRHVAKMMEGAKIEKVNNWLGIPVNVFQYAAISERCMEEQLANLKGEKRKTTFMSDLSIAEWYGIESVMDTVKIAMTSWKDDEKYMAEFVLCVNWKAWEHHARNNNEWAKFYSLLYEVVRDLVYDYYKGDEAKTTYVWSYLD